MSEISAILGNADLELDRFRHSNSRNMEFACEARTG